MILRNIVILFFMVPVIAILFYVSIELVTGEEFCYERRKRIFCVKEYGKYALSAIPFTVMLSIIIWCYEQISNRRMLIMKQPMSLVVLCVVLPIFIFMTIFISLGI